MLQYKLCWATCGLWVGHTRSNHFLNTSMYGDSTTSLSSLFQHVTTLLEGIFFLISSLNHSAATWSHSLSFHHCYMEEANSHLTTPSIPVIVDSNVLSEPAAFPEERILVPSATPHNTWAPDPSSTLAFREGFEELLFTSNLSPFFISLRLWQEPICPYFAWILYRSLDQLARLLS